MKTNKPLTIDVRAARRVICVMLAALLTVVTAPVLFTSKADAAQLQSRSIQLSDSAPSGGSVVTGVGSGTSVSYQVTFTVTNEAASLVIDFCSNDPIISDTCTAPTGMVATAATLNATAYNGTVDTTHNWAVTAAASQIKLADDNVGGSGGTHPTHDIQAAATESFQLNGITNPSTTGTFYGRVYTYPENSWCALGQTSGATCYSSATSLGTAMTDYGGVALSTVAVIQITARVQESLTFCVTAADPNTWSSGTPSFVGTCASSAVASAPPTITLGHSVGGGTPVLTPQAIDSTPVFSQLSTNATNGAIVNLRTANATCTYTGDGGFLGGGLSADGGSTCNIPPIADGVPAAGGSAMTAGTAAIGLNVCNYTSTGQITTNLPATQSGNLDPTTDYDGGAGNCPHTQYGMDTHTATGSAPYPGQNGNVSTTYGSTVAVAHITGTTPGPIFAADDMDTFAATAGLTTPAGIYTANLVMIATGTF